MGGLDRRQSLLANLPPDASAQAILEFDAPQHAVLPDDVPNYIPLGETEGLPAPLEPESHPGQPADDSGGGAGGGGVGGGNDYQQRARGLVKQHRAGLKAWFRRNPEGAGQALARHTINANSNANTDTRADVDVEKRGDTSGFGFGSSSMGGFGGMFAAHHHHHHREQGQDGSGDREDRRHSHGRRTRSRRSSASSSSSSEFPSRGPVQVRGTGGVLSSLLALYSSQQGGGQGSSTDTSRATTPAGSVVDMRGMGSTRKERERDRREEKERREKDRDARERRRRRERESQRAAPPSTKDTTSTGAEQKPAKKSIFSVGSPTGDKDRPSPPEHSHSSTPPSAEGQTPLAPRDRTISAPNTPLRASHRTSTASSSMDNIARALKVKPVVEKVENLLTMTERPAAARSGGGVFGALIANTGNLMGAAAPAASTIGPTVKRSGYHLSRYVLLQAFERFMWSLNTLTSISASSSDSFGPLDFF